MSYSNLHPSHMSFVSCCLNLALGSLSLFYQSVFRIHFSWPYVYDPSALMVASFLLLPSASPLRKWRPLWVYPPPLAHKVSVGLGASSPTEARQSSPARRTYPTGNSFWDIPAPVVQNPQEDQAARLLHICLEWKGGRN